MERIHGMQEQYQECTGSTYTLGKTKVTLTMQILYRKQLNPKIYFRETEKSASKYVNHNMTITG